VAGDIIVGAAKHAHDWVDTWPAVATIAGAFILLLYTIAALRQVSLTAKALREAKKSREETAAAALRSDEATKKSNKIAEDNMKLGRRSWLVLSRLRAPKTLVPDEQWEFTMTVNNCGGIPATNVACRFSLLLVATPRPLPEKQEIKLSAPPIGVAALAPGKAPVTGVGQDLKFTKAILEQIKSGELAMYIYCRFDYRDALLDQLAPDRWSSGCWRFWSDRGSWIIAEKHNDAP